MESVWWVVQRLWEKDLIYKDFKVLPYSWGATTVLSNFEANLDYRDVDDPAITVRLELLTDRDPVVAGDYLLIWTTTPWTLPGNLAGIRWRRRSVLTRSRVHCRQRRYLLDCRRPARRGVR